MKGAVREHICSAASPSASLPAACWSMGAGVAAARAAAAGVDWGLGMSSGWYRAEGVWRLQKQTSRTPVQRWCQPALAGDDGHVRSALGMSKGSRVQVRVWCVQAQGVWLVTLGRCTHHCRGRCLAARCCPPSAYGVWACLHCSKSDLYPGGMAALVCSVPGGMHEDLCLVVMAALTVQQRSLVFHALH